MPSLSLSLSVHKSQNTFLCDRGVFDRFIARLPIGMTFESVTHVDIDETPFTDDKIQLVEQFLRRTPNMTCLSLRMAFYLNVEVESVIRFISSIQNLECFSLNVPYSNDHFKRLLEFLLTSRVLPKLKHLAINYGSHALDTWIVSALALDINPGFRQLTMEHQFVLDRNLKAKFVVRKRNHDHQAH